MNTKKTENNKSIKEVILNNKPEYVCNINNLNNRCPKTGEFRIYIEKDTVEYWNDLELKYKKNELTYISEICMSHIRKNGNNQTRLKTLQASQTKIMWSLSA